MKLWKDPFPRTPERFSLRMEQTLRGLEDRDMKKRVVFRRTMAIVVAALVVLMAVTAAAVVAGNSNLKDRLAREGAGEVARLVQEPHMEAEVAQTGAETGFSFSVDEILWEDDRLFISYSLSVPADGKYLVTMDTPVLNGEKLKYEAIGWTIPKFFDQYGDGQVPAALLFGGTHDASCNELWTFRVDPSLRDKRDNELKFRVVLLRTDADILGGGDMTDMLNPPDAVFFNPNREDWDTEGMAEGEIAFLDGVISAFGDDDRLSLDELIDTGYADYVDEREIVMNLDASGLSQTVYNDVSVHDFDVGMCRIHVDAFRMTHLGISIRCTLSAPGCDADDAYRHLEELLNLNWDFATLDGKPLGYSLGASASAGFRRSDDGAVSCEVNCNSNVILPLEGLTKIACAPVVYADGSSQLPKYDMDRAITLSPIYSEDVAETEAVAPKDLIQAEEPLC